MRIGLALSDPSGTVATPLATVAVDDPDDLHAIAASISEIARDRQADTVVVGLPRALSGREGHPAQRARAVADRLRQRGLVVALWDERFTTVEAERVMLAQDASRRERRQALDRVAATLLLQTYLDHTSSGA